MSSRSPSDVATNAKQLRTFLEKGKTSLVDVDHKVRNRILTLCIKGKRYDCELSQFKAYLTGCEYIQNKDEGGRLE